MPEALLPLFLKLAGRPVLLVGGGAAARAKLGALLESGAEVTVVAPMACPEIASARVTLLRREFEDGDLDQVWLVVAAATPDVNARVAAACAQRRIWVNAVDQPADASAYSAAVVRRGGVTIAVSTEGRAPALAGLLREALDALLPETVEAWVAEAEALRRRQKALGVAMERRRPQLLERLVALHAREAS